MRVHHLCLETDVSEKSTKRRDRRTTVQRKKEELDLDGRLLGQLIKQPLRQFFTMRLKSGDGIGDIRPKGQRFLHLYSRIGQLRLKQCLLLLQSTQILIWSACVADNVSALAVDHSVHRAL